MTTSAGRNEQSDALGIVRRAMLILFVFAMLGTGTELVLLDHTEGFWQLAPLLLIGASLIVLAWHVVDRRRASVRAFQGIMLLCVASGVVGLVLHYRGNVEFEREMYPNLSGLELFWGAMTGATPSLAPGTMTLLGLLGLLYTYGHPALTSSTESVSTSTG